MNQEANLLPWEGLKKYFLLSVPIPKDKDKDGKDGSVACMCMLCKKKLQVTRSTSFNIKRHLKLNHPEEHKVYKTTHTNKRKHEGGEEEGSPLKQLKLDKNLTCKKTANTVTQKQVDSAIKNFIVKGVKALSTTDRPEFRELIQTLQPNKTVISRKTLTLQIQNDADEHKMNLKSTFENVKHIATTGDYWTMHNRCFYGSTAHHICETTLQRKSTLLACRRVKGTKDYKAVRNTIDGIHKDFAIQNKIVSTTTDNASNFVKAFRVYGQEPIASISEEYDGDELDDEPEFMDLETILVEGENEDISSSGKLPRHQRCVAHSLNLLASKNTLCALKDDHYAEQYNTTLGKARTLVKKQNRSSNCADLIKGVCGVYLKTPTDVRWNSEFDSIRSILAAEEKNPGCINKCCDKIGIESFDASDFAFLKEYCKVLSPLAMKLDYLQGENHAYMGVLLPTLHSLKRDYFKLGESILVYCTPLVEAIIDGIDKRFGQIWFRKDLVLAAVTHPEFQFMWIMDKDREDKAMRWLKEEIAFATPRPTVPAPRPAPSPQTSSLFDFAKPAVAVVINASNDELEKFLKYPSEDLSCLHSLPIIKTLFIKYNTPIPASAAIERVFSIAGELFSKRRVRLTDNNFENLLLLKFKN